MFDGEDVIVAVDCDDYLRAADVDGVVVA